MEEIRDISGSVSLTREKQGTGDLSVETPGVVTRARKRRMMETSGVRNIQKEVNIVMMINDLS